MKYFIGIVIFIMHISCGSSSILNDGSNSNDLRKTELDQEDQMNEDTILSFTCDSLSQSIEVTKINWVHFNGALADCLLTSGFNGVEEANKQIATIIENTKYYDLFIFGGRDVDYRGSTIFEAFLNKSQDYTLLNLADDGEDSIYAHGTVADVYMGYYCTMIKSIDGWEPYDYISKMVNHQELDNFLYGEDGLFNPAYGIEVGTKTYNAMLKAWQEGKIVFKAYGEK